MFTLLTAVFMVLAFSAMGFAANQVIMKTTVPNIPKSTCYQAGTDTMELDSLTNIEEGDVIEYTLNNKVTLCKAINVFLTFANTAGVLDTTGDLPVSTTGGAITAAGAGLQWGFLITAPVGSQTISLQLRKVLTATGLVQAVVPGSIMTFTGTALTDKMVIKLFDGKTGVFATSGFHKQATPPVALTYDTNTVAADNVLCIDTLTQDYQGEYVQNTPNSIPVNVARKLNFSGDYIIAHILPPQTYSLYTCKGATCGNILMGSTTQSSATCVAFDYETIGNGINGYCSNHTATVGVPRLIVQSTAPFELTNYVVSAEILVNGVAGEKGVYWSNTPPVYGHYALGSDACTGGGVGGFAATYLRGDNLTTAVPVAPIAGACAGVAAAAKAVKWTSNAAGLPLFISGDMFLEINLPPFNYNLAEVNAGDVVSVRITLQKSTCGIVGTFDLCIGTFIGTCPAPVGTSTKLFPYFTSLGTDPVWWNGIAIVNTSGTAGTATLTAYEQDGSVGTFTTPSIAAHSMYINLLSNIAWVGAGVGDSPAYISVTGQFPSLEGFGMIANPISGESMGYLAK